MRGLPEAAGELMPKPIRPPTGDQSSHYAFPQIAKPDGEPKKEKEEKSHWQLRAACRSLSTKLFFSVDVSATGFDNGGAKAVCRACPVRTECFKDVFESDESEYGVWGGLTAEERHALDRATQDALRSLGIEPTDGRWNMLRRRLLGLFGAVFLEPWELTRILTRPTIDDDVLASLEQSTADLYAAHRLIFPQEHMALVQAHMRTVTGLLGNPQRQLDHRQRLLVIEGRLATLAGVLLSDLHDPKAASEWYQLARSAGREANDPALCGWALGNQSFYTLFTGPPDEALRLAVAAEEAAGAHVSASRRSWLFALQARAHALRGDSYNSLRAQDRADVAMGLATPEERHPAPGFGHFDEARLAAVRGRCLVLLDLPHVAEPVLREALTIRAPSEQRRALLLLDLARAYAAQGEIEEACQVVAEAATIPAEHRVATVTQQGRELWVILKPCATHPAVEEVSEQLRLLANL